MSTNPPGRRAPRPHIRTTAQQCHPPISHPHLNPSTETVRSTATFLQATHRWSVGSARRRSCSIAFVTDLMWRRVTAGEEHWPAEAGERVAAVSSGTRRRNTGCHLATVPTRSVLHVPLVRLSVGLRVAETGWKFSINIIRSRTEPDLCVCESGRACVRAEITCPVAVFCFGVPVPALSVGDRKES